ncbi:hypothetical protein D0T49_03315 [Paludibacter sp. 221]|uniref:foldase protein PrsA n=1 Tax=Paludibacter sp. 221 TaxID=2302939 RepID=UPI0013D6C534|nr:peptidylprolyl isomerase [Paludibacter sp. 221]NDV46070.1 hypothetical protein [Paludibacter sp. 221]
MKALKILLFSLLFISGSLLAQTKNDPVLMEINGNPVTKSEFEYIYNKNNSTNSIDKKTLNEYVDLFVNFKLKVEEAKAQGLDTTAAFIKEYNGYRSQLARPYLVDKKAEEAVVEEAYNRMKEDIEVSHILIRIPFEGATAADTLAAWKKIKNVEKRLKKEKFDKVAREVSEDQSAAENSGYLGWISAFNTIYPFETVAYNTPVGATSAPVRTVVGYHIIKVHNRRPSQGEVLTSHIMLFTEKDDKEQNKVAKERIDSLYQRVLAGDDFGTLASNYSEDRGSAIRNGELPWFGTGRMVPEFEKAAFALKEVGDVSKPIQSAYGWHIIKLLDKRGIPAFEDVKADIERRVKRDERVSRGKDALVDALKKEYDFRIQQPSVDEFTKLLDGTELGDSAYIAEISLLNKPLMSFAGKQYSQVDFARFIKSNSYSAKSIPSEIMKEKLDAFVAKELLDYEDTRLANKYDDFCFLSQEYYDGILLFEISNKEVWDKASKDTEGLSNYFNDNRNNYTWDKPHYKGRVIYAKDKASMKAAKSIIKKAPKDSIDKQIRTQLNDSIQYVKVEKGLFVQGDNKVVDDKIFKAKEKYEPTEEYPYVFVSGKLLKSPEDYTDVRGLVTADYQTYLEQEWIKYLRGKYPVVVNEEVLKTVKKN